MLGVPSPLGHLLASVTVALALAPAEPGSAAPSPVAPSARPAAFWPPAAAAMALVTAAGLLPDLDLLVGRHSAASHSVGAAVIAGIAAAMMPSRGRLRFGVAVGLAYLTHPLLDWLSEDTSVPLGVMALWPFSSSYWHSGLDWFGATDRRYWLDGFLARNLRSVSRELLILGPVALGVWGARSFVGRGRRRSPAQPS